MAFYKAADQKRWASVGFNFLQVLSENQMLTNELTSLGDLNTRIAVLLSMTATPREKSICSSNS